MEINDGMGETQRLAKRLTDIIGSLLGLVLLSPLFLYIALRLRRQGNGPVIFRQKRLGKAGKEFTIYKFRTLSSVIEDNGPRLISSCDDCKSTPFEQWLRGHHLDELPQLWNVLRGDMSIVGPRPERRYYAEKIREAMPEYDIVLRMRPGLTSEATLYNGYTDTLEKMLTRTRMDIDYYRRRSLWLDTKITIETALSIIGGKNF